MCIRDSILLITDRFNRRADIFPVTAAEFAAEGTANVLVNKYISLWACPRTILSDNGLQFCKLSQAIYHLLGVHKLATSSYHPNGNGGVERVNHTMAQILAMVVNEQQDDWDFAAPLRRVRLQQFGQRGNGFGAQRGSHG